MYQTFNLETIGSYPIGGTKYPYNIKEMYQSDKLEKLGSIPIMDTKNEEEANLVEASV